MGQVFQSRLLFPNLFALLRLFVEEMRTDEKCGIENSVPSRKHGHRGTCERSDAGESFFYPGINPAEGFLLLLETCAIYQMIHQMIVIWYIWLNFLQFFFSHKLTIRSNYKKICTCILWVLSCSLQRYR